MEEKMLDVSTTTKWIWYGNEAMRQMCHWEGLWLKFNILHEGKELIKAI